MSAIAAPGLYQSMKDEDYLLLRAKEEAKVDPFASKSWLLTAQTIYPNNFNVQFQIYQIAKEERSIAEAAKCLGALFQVFNTDPLLWVEIDSMMNTLCEQGGGSPDLFVDNNLNPILIQIFEMLEKDTQKLLVTCASERAKDTTTYCSLMLLLTHRFPESTAYNGLKLGNALIKAEKNIGSPLNPFRKKLVCDLLPKLLKAEGLEVPPKVLHHLLTKSVEFYIAYSTTPPRVASVTLEAELFIEDPWKELFTLIRLIGWNLGWELALGFDSVSNREEILGNIQAMVGSGARLGGPKGDNGEDVREVLFTTMTLFLHALMDYTRKLYPDFMHGEAASYFPPPLTLIEAFVQPSTAQTPISPMSPPFKRQRHSFSEESTIPVITVSNVGSGSCSSSNVALPDYVGDLSCIPLSQGAGASNQINSTSSRALSQALITAIKCWDLLHSYEQVRSEFLRLLEGLNISRWLAVFDVDILIYEGRLADAERQIRHTLGQQRNAIPPCPSIALLTLNLKLASILFALNKLSAAAECVVEIMDKLTPLSSQGGLSHNLVCSTSILPVPQVPPLSPLHTPPLKAPTHRRHLHLLAVTKPQCLQFTCTLLVYALRHLVVQERSGDDLCIGHLIVLLQYDWPRFESIFEEVLKVVKQKGGFAYQFFQPYVTTPDILEEFIFLSSNLGGGLQLDIIPLLHTTKYMSTRGADRDSKHDFKHAMRRQMLRASEAVEPNIVAFLTGQGPFLSHVFM